MTPLSWSGIIVVVATFTTYGGRWTYMYVYVLVSKKYKQKKRKPGRKQRNVSFVHTAWMYVPVDSYE